MTNIINVIDQEFSCYPDGIFPPGERKEWIEVGITEVDFTTLEIIRTVSIPVKPTMSKISDFCTGLTGWTYAKLMKQGVSAKEMCRRLEQKHAAGTRLVITDSSDELEAAREQCVLHSVKYPYGNETMNISLEFSLVTGIKRRLSLENKLAHWGMQFIGTPHRAGSDSYNIARLFIAHVKQGRLAATQTGRSRRRAHPSAIEIVRPNVFEKRWLGH